MGELVQHDTSFHHWAPDAEKKWYLITSIDDYSRMMLYADLWTKESSWAHIVALKAVITRFGCPSRYYVDNHSIFRFVEKRDSLYKKYSMTEEESFVQWKEVLKDLDIEVIYALSPQAKGKVERAYRWIQDHLVRTCARENIKKIESARKVLYEEIHEYNYKRVHSTTGEIPAIRYEKALKEKRSVFKEFKIKAPYKKKEDIFCIRLTRVVDAYRKISVNKLKFSISKVPIREKVELRITFKPHEDHALIRFWYKNQLVGEKVAKITDLNLVRF